MTDAQQNAAESGKRFVAANPWPLAAEAKRLGLRTDQFQESDYVPDGKVYIIDLDELTRLPESFDV
jgi:hypothetical protein